MSVKLKKVAIFGEGIYSRSPIVTRQRRLNCYLEVRKDQDKSSIVCYGTPGLKYAFNASMGSNLALRGMLGNPGALYAVSNNTVSSLTSSGAVFLSGTIGTSQGLVGMALNPTQLMVVDGSTGYVFNPTTGNIIAAPASFPNGAKTITYCNGFFIAELPGTNQFFVSALNDGTTWPGLSFATAVQAVDGIAAVDTVGGILIIFSTGHTEFWQNIGTVPEPFIYIQNSASMYGLAAINSRVHAGDAILFLTRTNGGSFQNSGGGYTFAQINGYSVKTISTADVDNILQTMAAGPGISDCTGYSYQVDNHIFVQWNFTAAGRSLLYDVTEKLWHETQSGLTPQYSARHLGNLAANAFGQTYVADYSNANVYTYDPNTYTDNGNIILRQVISRVALDDFNTMRIGQIYLDMRTGVGLSNPNAQGYAPMVGLSLARDNRNFGYERLVSLGLQGQYLTRVNTRRWGRARQANLQIRMTDPVPFEITGGAMMISSRSRQATPARRRI